MKWGLTNECFEDEKREETYRKVCYFAKIKPEILAFALNSNILMMRLMRKSMIRNCVVQVLILSSKSELHFAGNML